MAITITDVAKKAGVSTASVSLVLSGQHQGRVSQKRTETILDAAKELNYVGNSLAASLRKKKTKTLGFVSDVVASTPYAYAMVAAANRRANELGYMLLISETGGDPKTTQDVFANFMSHQVSAIAYASMHHHAIELPQSHPKHIIVLDGYAANEDAIAVVPNEVQGASVAVQHLLDLGHKKIGFINDRRSKDAGPLRLKGYRTTLENAGITVNDNYIAHVVTGTREVDEVAEKMLSMPDCPSAIFCYNDETAAGVYRVARRLNLRIPEDLSVVGFDNFLPIAKNLDPQLTTVQLPHEEMATWVIDSLVKMSDESFKEPAERLIKFNCPLIKRDSTQHI